MTRACAPGLRAIPSEILGNGLSADPLEALAVGEWLAGADRVDTLAVRLEDEARRVKPKLASDDDAPPNEAWSERSRTAAKATIDVLVPNLIRLGLIV